MKKPKLNTRQEQFCQEYLLDLNSAVAARRAGYSEETARSMGCQLLTKLNIQTRCSSFKRSGPSARK